MPCRLAAESGGPPCHMPAGASLTLGGARRCPVRRCPGAAPSPAATLVVLAGGPRAAATWLEARVPACRGRRERDEVPLLRHPRRRAPAPVDAGHQPVLGWVGSRVDGGDATHAPHPHPPASPRAALLRCGTHAAACSSRSSVQRGEHTTVSCPGFALFSHPLVACANHCLAAPCWPQADTRTSMS